MMLKKLIISMTLLCITSIGMAEGEARISVNFNAPEKFTDFKTMASFSDTKREKLMENLRQLMIESTNNYIPVDYKMTYTINNIDMAGTFQLGNSDLYRVVNQSDRIRLDFSYELVDSEEKIVKKEDVNISSTNPKILSLKKNKYKNTTFSHEMPLFDEWVRNLDF